MKHFLSNVFSIIVYVAILNSNNLLYKLYKLYNNIPINNIHFDVTLTF